MPPRCILLELHFSGAFFLCGFLREGPISYGNGSSVCMWHTVWVHELSVWMVTFLPLPSLHAAVNAFSSAWFTQNCSELWGSSLHYAKAYMHFVVIVMAGSIYKVDYSPLVSGSHSRSSLSLEKAA